MQPDPEHPAIANGSFEEILKDKESGVETPAGWHYQRQLTLVDDPSKSPDGKRYITFRNEQPGRGCQALQGFAVDGRKVAKLRLAFSVRGHNVQPGPTPDQQPVAVVIFYDDRRATIGVENVLLGSVPADWEREERTIAVPLKAPRGDRADRAVGGNGRDVAG